MRKINEEGVTIKRGEESLFRRVPAFLNGEERERADVVLLFTKAYQTREVLLANRALLGEDTLLLTLQNGAGHEEVLRDFADSAHVLIGTTKQGSYRESPSVVVNSGLGETVFGGAPGPGEEGVDGERLKKLCQVFEEAGFPCSVSENIRYEVWNKLMINASSSVLSGVLQMPQGYVAQNPQAWSLCEDLIREICLAARGEGAAFSSEEQILRVRQHLLAAPGGYTSIYADLKNGRRTEVDYINGAVVRAARKHKVATPTHELMVRLVHALEERGEEKESVNL